jgi:photosystem II stability/assembly factor-like uncharacterized protein
MKQSCLFIILIILLFSCKNTPTNLSDVGNKMEVPSEHMAFMRSYPDDHLDISAYNQMLKSAELEISKGFPENSASWQLEGPTNIGGRITCLKIHPTNKSIMYAGCPGGGLFKTINSGATWFPIFDTKAFLSIACIEFDPNNPNTVFVGTGDPETPFTCFVGDGIYKSTDGGNTWNNIGLNQQGIISKILIHPTNPNILYASAMGVPMERNSNRGVYKSINGGGTWAKVLNIDNQTGVSDMMMDFVNPNIIYASSWTRIRTNRESIGASNTTRIYKTLDGGSTWRIMNNGLPNEKVSRLGMCMSYQNSSKIYVSVCDSNYEFKSMYVSNNGGNLFTELSGAQDAEGIYRNFGWYFGKIAVNPIDDDEIFIAGVEHFKSIDGGLSFQINQPPWQVYNPHADIHDIQFKSPNNYILATDGGLYETKDDGTNWEKIDDIPNTQFYKVNFNPHNNDEYLGGAQDNGTSVGGMTTGLKNWERVFGGDGFQPRIDSRFPEIRYCETQNGNIYSSLDGINYMNFSSTLGANDRKNWDMPYIFGGNSEDIMFTGTDKVYRNRTNPFEAWEPISPDLTDGNIFGARFHTISTLSNSRLDTNKVYVGTSDGNVWRSLNGGTTWDSLQKTLPNRYVTAVQASPNISSNVYVTHSGYRYNEYIPHIHKSINNGSTWINISGDLPQTGINDLIVLPGDENVIFVATDIGVYFTINAGVKWNRLGNNMPIIVIWDLEYNHLNKKLIAGTYARGLQTIDVSNLTVNSTTENIVLNSDIIQIYPNPTIDQLKVNLDSNYKLSSVRVLDISGKIVLVTKENFISLKDLSSGVYICKVLTDKGVVAKKFVKQD